MYKLFTNIFLTIFLLLQFITGCTKWCTVVLHIATRRKVELSMVKVILGDYSLVPFP